MLASSIHDARVASLIGRVYEAALENERWQGFAAEIAHTFESTSTVLKTHGSDGDVHLLELTDNLSIAAKDEAWAAHWHRNDLWVERSAACGLSTIITSQELLCDAELERTGFYHEWLRYLEIYHLIGAVFSLGPGRIGVLGIHRPRRAGAYGADDKRRVGEFLPHLQRALRLRERVCPPFSQEDTAGEILESLGIGWLLVDGCARVLHANSVARAICGQSKQLRIQAGWLTAIDPVCGERLQQSIANALPKSSGGPCVPGALCLAREGRLPLAVSVLPLSSARASFALGRRAVVVILRDPEQFVPAVDALKDLYGLTRTEAAVAAALARTSSLADIAEAFGIGIGTVRSHVKKVLAKTATRRQAELVALLLRSVPVVALRKS